MNLRTYTALLPFILVPLAAAAGAAPKRAPVGFNRDIRPILSDKCFACHGPDANKRQAGLRLDLAESALAARNGRRAVVPGKPEQSGLVRRITAASALKMPPESTGKKLAPAQIELLRRWVAEGAAYEPHWAYAPVRPRPLPPVKKPGRRLTPIDRFLLARMEAAGVKPSPEADPLTLIRRISFDLTGLPPARAEVEAFLRDCGVISNQLSVTSPEHLNPETAPLSGASARTPKPLRSPGQAPEPRNRSALRGKRLNAACDRLVDRLLASPRFGERMASFWLDLVRYADTVGYHGDQEQHVSPYRDYVIWAFNRDLPFDRFTTEQLAGDLLPDPTVNQRIASGYNRLLQTTHEGGAQDREYLAKYAADRVRNVSGVWLGATIGCAECHDHKYDPYTQKDFYSLAAFFADVKERGAFPGPDTTPTLREPELAVLSPFDQEEAERLTSRIEQLQRAARQCGGPAAAAGMRSDLEQARKQLEAIQKRTRPTLVTVSAPPRTTRVLKRGDWMDESGEVVRPAVPHFLPGYTEKPAQRLTRLDLARWLASPENPLTARVFVNRVWTMLFGSGLCRSLDDFGARGQAPVQPELLDFLAGAFVAPARADGEKEGRREGATRAARSPSLHLSVSPSAYGCSWSVKRLIRLIVTSSAYRQSSQPRAEDPENRLFARQERFRLPAEMVRDQALAASGLLVEKLGGPSAHPYQPEGYYALLNFPKREYKADTDEDQYRRGVYVHWQRQFLHPMLRAFDAPSREECTAQRPITNTPLQALALLNDPTFVETARVLAARMLREGGTDDPSRIRWGWRVVLSREPAGREVDALSRLLQRSRARCQADPQAAKQLVSTGLAPVPQNVSTAELAAWTAVGRALFNLNETITRE